MDNVTQKSTDEVSVTRAIEKFSDFLIVREPPLRSSAVALFPEPGQDAITRHAAQLFRQVEAQVLVVVRGADMTREELARMRDLLALYKISESMIRMMPHEGMHARMQILQLFHGLAEQKLLDPPQVTLVAAPHKTRRYMALFERWAPRYVAACVCPPQVSVAGFVSAEDAEAEDAEGLAALYAQARMLAREVKAIESRLIRQQITLEGGIPSGLSASAEQFVSETVADRPSIYS